MKSGNARLRRDDLSPALFPFLAVMVCTIGALVFILTIAVTQASQAAKAELQDARDELQIQQDFVEVAKDELLAQREELQKQIDRSRNSLAHLDDHIQRIKDEIESTKQAIASSQAKDQTPEAEDPKSQVATLQKELERLQQQLQEKLEDRKTSKPAFSIIPYAGPNGTSRRPIYLECTAKGVLIQPEGILLTLDDLKPPHGPGNPLDASLRTIRAKLQEFDGSSNLAAPYPLLLVRPDGIAAYALARACMASWEDQHGYELIEADMPLAFPNSIPGLSDDLNRIIASARTRQKDIVASLPRRVASNMDWTVEATDLAVEHGDSVPAMSGRVVQDFEGTFIPQKDAWAQGTSSRTGGNGAVEEEWQDIGGNVPVPAFAQKTNLPYATPDDRLRFQQDGFGASPGSMGGSGESGTGTDDGNTGQSMDGQTSGMNSPNPGGGATANNLAPGSSMQTATDNMAQQASGAPNIAGFGTPSVTGATTLNTGDQANQADTRAQQEELAKNDPSQPTAVIRPASNRKNNTRSRTAIANELGEDWAVQQRRLSSTPIHRAISIRVFTDRWIVVDSESRSIVRSEIMLTGGPRAARQKLREEIEEEVEDWGVAVSGGYWVPIIKIYSEPNSEWATQQLVAMLDGSGAKIELQR